MSLSEPQGGYIYIPTDIICENSSLKKFTAWQIRLNYLRAKTNRLALLNFTRPRVWIDNILTELLSFIFSIWCHGCTAWLSCLFANANLDTEWTRASIAELKIQEFMTRFQLKNLLWSVPLNCLQNWLVDVERISLLTLWWGQSSVLSCLGTFVCCE